ncbi:MAG: arsenate reductase/protein-tyrosine-phosphatase family protein [Candidatus Hodarchaeales archaeon]|jgi:protein-tyrosine phosphatase
MGLNHNIKKQYKILFICSGNIMRSPMAEMLFEKLLTEKYDNQWKRFVIVDSGAVRFKNSEIYPYTKEVLINKGIPEDRIKKFVPRHIENHPQLFEEADIILTMTEGQRKRLLSKYNSNFENKTYILPEYVKKDVTIPDPWFSLRRKKKLRETAETIEECLVSLLTKFETKEIIKIL